MDINKLTYDQVEKAFVDSMSAEHVALIGSVVAAYDVVVSDPNAQGRGFDLRSLAFRNRILYLHGPVTTESMNLLVMQAQYLCSPAVLKQETAGKARDTRRLIIYVNSPGGSVTAGLFFKECLRQIKEITNEPVYVINQECAASMGSSITQSASKGCRLGFIPTQQMIHESAYGMQGKASEHAERIGMNVKLESQLWSSYEQAILAHRELFYGDDENDPVLRAQVRHFILSQSKRRDTFFTGNEAQKYGLLDFVITNTTDQQRYYTAMEYYLGLRSKDGMLLCDMYEGQSQPFKFDGQDLTPEDAEELRAEGLRRLRELRDESIKVCDSIEADWNSWAADLNEFNSKLMGVGNGPGADAYAILNRLYKGKAGVTDEDLFSDKNPFYME